MASKAPEDFALIVGIDDYPDLPDLPPLEGPVNDARAFERWVVSHAGVDSQNVFRVLSSKSALGEPTAETVDRHFLNLCEWAEGKGGRLGHRLYVFMAGHGIAQAIDEASLLTANARKGSFTAHVPSYRYCNYLRMAACFDEIVLFADCCRTDVLDVAIRPFPRPPRISPRSKKVRYLYGFAARFGQSAGDGERGFFSRVLIDGLNGSGRGRDGKVTMTSLREFLLNDPRLLDLHGAQDPELIGDDIVLADYETSRFPVRLKVTPRVKAARIRGDVTKVDEQAVEEGVFEIDLPRGFYAIEAGRSKGLFEVTGEPAKEIEVRLSEEDRPGAGEEPGDRGVVQTCRVRLVGKTPATEVYLVGPDLQLEEGGLREICCKVPPGVYKARFQLGPERCDQLVNLQERETVLPEPGAGLCFNSPVPLRWTRTEAIPMAPPPDSRGLAITVRGKPGRAPSDFAASLSLARGDGREVALHPTSRTDGGVTLEASEEQAPPVPGMYTLLLRTEGDLVARAVPVLAGRTTHLFIERLDEDPSSAPLALLSSAMLTTSGAFSESSETALMTEVARQALARQHAVFHPKDIIDAIRRGVDDPLFALYAVHAWLGSKHCRSVQAAWERPAPSAEEQGALHAIYSELSNAFGDLPDVAVLGWLYDVPVRFGDTPPLLHQSWHLWELAALEDEKLLAEAPRMVALAGWEVNSQLWWAWKAAGGSPAGNAHAQAVRHVFGPALRVNASRAPLWAQGQTFLSVVSGNATAAASALQLPKPLAIESARALDDAERDKQQARLRLQLEALKNPARPLCLVCMPSGLRIDSERGAVVDFESVYEDVIEPAVLAAGWTPVRLVDAGASLSPDAMRARARLFDVLVGDVTFADPAVLAELGYWAARKARRVLIIKAKSQQAAVLPGFPPALDYTVPDGGFQDSPLDLGAHVRVRWRSGSGAGGERERLAVRRELAALSKFRRELRELRVQSPQDACSALAKVEGRIRRGGRPGSAVSEAIRASMLAELFFAYRSAGDWEGMLRLVERMPAGLRNAVVVREQRAWALNKLKGSPAEQEEWQRHALESLHSVVRDIGPNGETCGLLGSVYKQKWKWLLAEDRGDEAAAAALDSAIDWYARGFDATPSDPYPGINALTLLLQQGGRMAMNTRERMLPAVELAATRRLRARPGYWDYATMVELAVHRRDRDAAYRYFEFALQVPRNAGDVGTTVANLKICHEAFRSMGTELAWLVPLCDQALAGKVQL